MSLLWISSTRPDGIPAIEQTTGLKVTVSDAEPMTWNATITPDSRASVLR